MTKRDRFDVEEWYPYLREETFATEIISLSYKEAQALLHACDDFKHNVREKSTEFDKETLLHLQSRIDEAISRWVRLSEGGAFIRMSKRSPKDAALLDKRLRDCFNDEMRLLQGSGTKKGEDDVSLAVIALTRAVTKLSMVRTGAEALDMLIRSQKRIYPDLTLLLLENSEDEFSENIILREFVDLLPEMEFRGFVNGGKMNALSQYNSLCFVPELISRKDEFKGKILEYFAKVKDLIPEQSYVIDFAVMKNGTVAVIELNPFSEASHGCLFDWHRDREVLERGQFECRITTEPVKNARERLASELRSIIDEFYPPSHPNEDIQNKKKCCIL